MQRLRDSHELELLQGGQEYFASLVAAIDASVHEVRLETYIFNFDASGRQVAAAMERAAVRGVQVFVTVDGVGTPQLPAPWRDRFDRAGVQWRIFLPLGHFGLLIPSRWRRLHRKLCVVDDRVAYCGGINLLDDFVDPNHGALSQPRLDFAVRVTGPLVHDMAHAMTRFWSRLTLASQVRGREFPAAWRALQASLRASVAIGESGPNAAADTRRSESRPSHGARAELVLRDNLRNRTRIERAYLKAIGEARKEVVIANAYFLPGARLRKALVHAAGRGVRVRLLLQGRYEYFLPYHASRPVYSALLTAGVEIHEYAASFLHAKVAVIDGHWATVGSSNLDPLSLLLAREANLLVDDAAFASRLRERLEKAMASGGKAVDAVVFSRRSLRRRTLEMLAFALMRLALFLVGRRY
ncbi:MAG: cardiolipin synthase ClsB [Burkholderiaceae bacterium]